MDQQSHQILDDSAFTHIAIDASLFESTRTVGWSEAEDYFENCDQLLIKQIIDKGRFSNQIAKALHEEKKTDQKFELTVSGQTTMTHLQMRRASDTNAANVTIGGGEQPLFGKLASTSFGPHFKDSMHKVLEVEPLQTISEETSVPQGKNVSQTDQAATQATGGTGEDTPRSLISSGLPPSVPQKQEEEKKTEVHTPTTTVNKSVEKQPAIPASPGILSQLSVQGSMRSEDSLLANKSNSQIAASPMKSQEPTTPNTPTVAVTKPPEEEKKAVVAPPPKPAAKPAPAPSGRRRRVIKKPEEKKKE